LIIWVILKANKTHFYPADQETLRIKLSELREKEIKLKKTEDQLKVREKVINDEKQKRIWLDTYDLYVFLIGLQVCLICSSL
jgi:hypothetical protein